MAARGDTIQIMTYNYCHYDDLYALGDTSFIDETHRYNGFKEEKILKSTSRLAGYLRARTAWLPKRSPASTAAQLRQMGGNGAPESLTAEDIAYLKESSPLRQVQVLNVENGR